MVFVPGIADFIQLIFETFGVPIELVFARLSGTDIVSS
jgi:hypothetical protein